MTTPHTIEIEITEDGEIKSTVQGVSGPSCEDLARWLEELGDTVEHYHTPDYYRRQRVAPRTHISSRR